MNGERPVHPLWPFMSLTSSVVEACEMTDRRYLVFLCGRTSEGAATLFLNGAAKSFSCKVGGTHTGGTASSAKRT
jgi:hypothetical protein